MFAQLLDRVASAETARSSLITDGQFTVSHAELTSLVAAVGDHLLAQGVKATDCLALECPNAIPAALTIFALMERGISFFLLPPVAQNQAALTPVPQFCRYRVRIDAGSADADANGAQYPVRLLTVEANEAFQPLPAGTDHGPRCIYLRTSGSMGNAKIVVHSHDNFIGNAHNCVKKYALEASDRVAIPIPLAHIYGLAGAFLPAFAAGASIDLQSNSNHLQYFAREKIFKPNVAFLTPTICDQLLPGFSTPRAYKVVVTSAQRISDDLFRRFDEQIGGTLINIYGSSELGTVAGCAPHDPLESKLTTIGQPLQTANLQIQQPDPATGVGELQCQNTVSFVGYVDETGTWLQQNREGAWFDTGDLATVTDTGSIRLVGRAKNSTNRNGYLVMFSDIERIMEEFEEIAQAVVVASGQETERGQALFAFCIPEPGVALNSQQVRRRCFDKLPRYAVPDEVRVMASLPLLHSGKVDQQALIQQAQLSVEEPVSPRAAKSITSVDDIIDGLTHLLVDMLEIQMAPAEIEPEMALLNTGLNLDSIALVRLTALIKERFQLEFYDEELELEALQSIRALAEWIYDQRAPQSRAAKAASRKSDQNIGYSVQHLRANVSLLHLRAAAFGISHYDLQEANQNAHDPASWSAELVKFAERYERAAQSAAAAHRTQSACQWWQMVVNYYHFVQMFIDVEQRKHYQEKCWHAYRQLATLSRPRCQRVAIPYRGMKLPGYLRVAQPGAPCIILLGGFEFSKEAELHQWGEYFLERGISVLAFDGPGQGELVDSALMHGDFESVVGAAIDYLVCQVAEVDATRIGLFGVSLGGYMALRAAAMEQRVTACISLSGPFDGSTTRNLAPRNQLVTARLFGFDAPEQLMDPQGPINLATVPRAITQPLFLIHGTLDHIVPVAQIERIQAWAQGATELWLLDDVEHCCFSRAREVMPVAGDWMARQLGVQEEVAPVALPKK